MSMQVLQNEDQIHDARRVMNEQGVSAVDTPVMRLMKTLRLSRGLSVGDRQKSWDVLLGLQFIRQHVAKNDPVADFGCFASEVLVALHRLGYSCLTGVDLNSRLTEMPHQDAIRYVVSDFMHAPFEDGAFKAITSISVIEHGFKPKSLLAEVSRLLLPGGFFIASFDYWPEKINTEGTTFFGMDWLIFSRSDVEGFIELAKSHGLCPVGDLEFGGKDRVINCAGKQYTFATLILTKVS